MSLRHIFSRHAVGTTPVIQIHFTSRVSRLYILEISTVIASVAANAIGGAAHVSKQALAFGRHGCEQVRVWMPVAPFGADGVVEVEDGDAVGCFICPGRGTVGDGFGEEEQ